MTARTEFQNEVDASSLYQLLENQIVPLYYAKPDGKLPLAWLQLMRESIRSVTPVFNTQRMVKEYTEQLYIRAAQAHENFSRDGCGAATHLSQWKAQMRKDWPQVQVSDVQVVNKDRQSISVGESLQVTARVHLGAVDPQHVRVEAYHGEVDNGDLRNPTATVLNQSPDQSAMGNGDYIYQGSVPATESGTYGFSVRVAAHASLPDASARTAPNHVVIAIALFTQLTRTLSSYRCGDRPVNSIRFLLAVTSLKAAPPWFEGRFGVHRPPLDNDCN